MGVERFDSIGLWGVGALLATLVACGNVEPTGTTTGTGGAATSSSASGKSTSTGTGTGGAGSFTGTCATLQTCCANIVDPQKRAACDQALQASGDLMQVCSDALVTFGPDCGGGASSVGTGVGGGSMCGSPGATPVALPQECQPIAGACLYHEHDTPMPGAQIVCMEYSGQWSQIPSSAQMGCTQGNAMHEWVAGKSCGEAEAGIQAGCEFHPANTTLCNVTYYGPGCMTALGSSCNTSIGVWVAP